MTEQYRPTAEIESLFRVLQRANRGRNQEIYQGYMSAATLAKVMSIFPHFGEVKSGAIIVDVGSGTGDVAEVAAQIFRDAHVIGVDIATDLIRPAYDNRSLVSYLRADGTKQNFNDNSLDIKIYGTIGHEIESFGGKGKMKEALAASYRELKPGGILIVRDFLQPDDKNPWYLQLLENHGCNNVQDATRDGKIDYSLLTKEALLKEFQKDFNVHRQHKSGPAFSYQVIHKDGQRYLKILPKWAHEFVLRKDYTANYLNEKEEEYLYWTASSGIAAMKAEGFVDVTYITDPNTYIKETRINNKVKIFRPGRGGSMQELQYPDTHALWIARKPSDKPQYAGYEQSNVADVIDTIKYDPTSQTLRIGDRSIAIDPNYQLIKGSKKMVFHLKNDPTKMLKVVRTDTPNHAAVFKAMREAVQFEDVLESHHVPHLRILSVDQATPTRYVYQEAISPGSQCAADLIRNNELSEDDVRQMAEIVNSFEREGTYQLDTNPFNWFRVINEDGSTQMTYVDGKVYPYEKNWDFKRIGLLQWNDAKFVSNVEIQSAHIPKVREYEEFAATWEANSSKVASWWKKYLYPDLQPKV